MNKSEIITECSLVKDDFIHQGDILTNVEYIEYADIVDGNIEISKINFPKVIILTQECDSIQDYNNRKDCYEKIRDNQEIKTNQFLLSTIVAPLYNLSDIVPRTTRLPSSPARPVPSCTTARQALWCS